MTDFDVGKAITNLFGNRDKDKLDSDQPQPVPLSEFNNDQSFFNKSVFNINSDTDNNTECLFDLSSSNKIKQLNNLIKTQNYMCNNKLKFLDHVLSEPSDSSESDSDDDIMSCNKKSNINKNTIYNIENIKYIIIKLPIMM